MAFSCQYNDAFDTLLLSAAHSGDVNALETHLLSVSDPQLYINRVYQESQEQKCTLLMLACLNGYQDMIEMLLKRFQPDLEVLNDIKINVNNQSPKLYENVTVLWAVAALNNFDLVKLFVDHGARVNHATKTNSTPLRCGCFHGNILMTRYLIDNDADIGIAKEHNDTNLILCVFRQHMELVIYLVDELKCDINECDDEGRSSLYLAVDRGSLELVKFLLSRGARNFPSTNDQLSPLMLAAEKRRTDLVELLMPHCSIIEQIQAEELLGSSYACVEYGVCDLDIFYEYLSRTFELRLIHQLPKVLKEKTEDVFEHRQECQTISQLNELRSNSDHMYIEALFIRERLLGSSNLKYRNSLLYRGATLASTKKYLQGICFWLYELELHKQYSLPISSKQLHYFIKTFTIMIYKKLSIPIQILCQFLAVIKSTLQNNIDEFDHNFHTLLFLITIICQSLKSISTSEDDRRVFYRLIHSTIQHQYTTRENGSSLLHLSLCDRTDSSSNSIDRICRYPCIDTVRTLLQCGADPNMNDAQRNTPMHIYASNSIDADECILQLLYQAGAHFDYANALDEKPIDVTLKLNTRQLLQGKMKLCLKCICARVIRTNAIAYQGKITKTLVNFVERH